MTDTQIQMRIAWQARDTEVNIGVNNLIKGSINELSFGFTDIDKFSAYNIKLTKERWDEFLDKHIYDVSGSKTQLPSEFRDKEAQKELLEKIIKLAVREKGTSGKNLGKNPDLNYIIKNIPVKRYMVEFVIGKHAVSQEILDLHPTRVSKKMLGG